MASSRKKKSHLLGIGLDNQDGHKRITQAEKFSIVGGSEETHDRMTETLVKTFEDLKRKGQTLEQTSRILQENTFSAFIGGLKYLSTHQFHFLVMDNTPDAPTPPNNTTPSQNTPAGVPQAPKLSLRPTPGASGTPTPAGTPPPSLSRPGSPAASSTPPPSMTRPGAPTPATPRPAPSSPETKPEFKPSTPGAPTPTAGVPPAPTFAKPPPGLHAAHAPVVGSAADIQMDFVDEEDDKEKLPFVLIDAVSLVASIAFAVMLFMQLFSLDGTK